MAEFKTPTSKRTDRKVTENSDVNTPIKIPATPYLQRIGYGTGVNVFTLERSPKVGQIRSPWAVKKRNRQVNGSKQYNDRIRFEAQVLRKLEHPNVVGYRGYTETDGEPCLAMEKLDSSLGDILEERVGADGKPLPANIIQRISYDVAKGLEYLHHTARILHGDLKSYNVLISGSFQTAKLCDFGVSVPLTESMELDKSKGDFGYVGTEYWCSPEILFDDGPVTNKADIWSYGLVIWEMLTLSPPITEESIESSMEVSVLETSMTGSEKEHRNPSCNTNDSVQFIGEVKKPKYGNRPPLDAENLGPEYGQVLEVYYACTTEHYPLRPTAKDLVEYFRRYVYFEKEL